MTSIPKLYSSSQENISIVHSSFIIIVQDNIVKVDLYGLMQINNRTFYKDKRNDRMKNSGSNCRPTVL